MHGAKYVINYDTQPMMISKPKHLENIDKSGSGSMIPWFLLNVGFLWSLLLFWDVCLKVDCLFSKILRYCMFGRGVCSLKKLSCFLKRLQAYVKRTLHALRVNVH